MHIAVSWLSFVLQILIQILPVFTAEIMWDININV